MIWRDIFLDKNISKKSIIKAFGLVFNIDANKIDLINDISQIKKLSFNLYYSPKFW